MNKKPGTSKDAADKLVKNIRRKTRQTYSAVSDIAIWPPRAAGRGTIYDNPALRDDPALDAMIAGRPDSIERH